MKILKGQDAISPGTIAIIVVGASLDCFGWELRTNNDDLLINE